MLLLHEIRKNMCETLPRVSCSFYEQHNKTFTDGKSSWKHGEKSTSFFAPPNRINVHTEHDKQRINEKLQVLNCARVLCLVFVLKSSRTVWKQEIREACKTILTLQIWGTSFPVKLEYQICASTYLIAGTKKTTGRLNDIPNKFTERRTGTIFRILKCPNRTQIEWIRYVHIQAHTNTQTRTRK